MRILVTNKLPEHTTIHWHGLLLPNGMDGVGGLNQPHIKPGETYAYEFELKQHGTFAYAHPHADEMVQMAVGMMGLFVVHPRESAEPPPARDFAIMLHEWAVHPGTYRPDPAVMLDFNHFSFNGKVFPATAPLVARTGQRVRITFGQPEHEPAPHPPARPHLQRRSPPTAGRFRKRAAGPGRRCGAGGRHPRYRVPSPTHPATGFSTATSLTTP